MSLAENRGAANRAFAVNDGGLRPAGGTMAVDLVEQSVISPLEGDVSSSEGPLGASAPVCADEQILQLLRELRAEVSALRSEVLGQNQQMLSRIQFLHEGLLGRIKQMREQAATPLRRRGR